MRIGITGETGFIGQNFRNLLVSKQIQHMVFDRDKTCSVDCESDVDDFVSECAENKCSSIVHLAGLNRNAKDIDILESHALPTYWLAKHCLKHNIKLIVSGSRISIGFYGAGKNIAKKIIYNFRMVGLRGVYLALPNVFGPFCSPYYNSFVTTILHEIAQNKSDYKDKISNPSSTLNLIHVKNVCKYMLNLCHSDFLNDEHFYPGEFKISIKDFCRVANGKKPDIELEQEHINSIKETLEWYK